MPSHPSPDVPSTKGTAPLAVARPEDTPGPGRPARGSSPDTSTGRGRPLVWVTIGLVLLALNLRPALVAVSPLLDTIRADTGMSTTMESLLTALPLLCFGLLAPLAPRIGRRWGVNVVLMLSMLVLTAGTALRLLDSTAALVAGSVVAGAGIAVANVLLPGVIKREFPKRAAIMSGVYSMALFGGAALAAGVTVPLQNAAGLGWRTALALWGLLAVLAMIAWLPQLLRRGGPPATGRATPSPTAEHLVDGLWKHPVAWFVALYFAAQALTFYSSAAYLPTMLTEAGLPAGRAGWMLSFSSLVAVLGAFSTPLLTARRVPPRLLVLLSTVLTAGGFAGMLAAPATATYAWMTLLGIGQGAGLSLSVLFIVQRSPDARHTAQLSSMAQCSGYILAAAGPFALGGLHQLTDSWAVPLTVLILLAVPTALVGLGSARKRYASHEITEAG